MSMNKFAMKKYFEVCKKSNADPLFMTKKAILVPLLTGLGAYFAYKDWKKTSEEQKALETLATGTKEGFEATEGYLGDIYSKLPPQRSFQDILKDKWTIGGGLLGGGTGAILGPQMFGQMDPGKARLLGGVGGALMGGLGGAALRSMYNPPQQET